MNEPTQEPWTLDAGRSSRRPADTGAATMIVQEVRTTDEQTEATEPPAWITEFDGDLEELRPHLGALLYDIEVSDRLFASKWEAFVHGFSLGETAGDDGLGGKEGRP